MRFDLPDRHRSSAFLLIVLFWGWLGIGCAKNGVAPPEASAPPDLPVRLTTASLDGIDITLREGNHALSLARNEWGAWLINVEQLPENQRVQLRLSSPTRSDGQPVAASWSIRVYQLLSVPLDLYRAGYVRHSGNDVKLPEVPRALLPLSLTDGMIDGKQLRPGTNRGAMLWIDVRPPIETPPGDYLLTIDAKLENNPSSPVSLAARVQVLDFVLPDERRLQIVADVPWDDLRRLYPTEFETITPRLLRRNDPAYEPAVSVLDQFMKVAHEHRVQLFVPRLQPTVKWPAGRPPEIDWRDFDSVVKPWLNGDAFENRVPLGLWPLPEIDYLENYPLEARLAYYAAAAAHFDQMDWLSRSPLWLKKRRPGRATADERIALSAEAARMMGVNERMRVAFPLEPDQVQFATEQSPHLLNPDLAERLLPVSPALVSTAPLQPWPDGKPRPTTWLRSDLDGLIPYVGAGGDESDVRLWAWLAFLRQASIIRFGSPLPSQSAISTPADPSELAWFYPGSWFGVETPVPTVQLKWLRRAQQDYEYLYLARQRGEVINALLMARLLCRPVEIPPGEEPDPTHGLMTGTTDKSSWDSALSLLARNILLREPGAVIDEGARTTLNLETLQWMQPREQPVLAGSSATWTLGEPPNPGEPNLLLLRLTVDVYNASDVRPEQNQLEFAAVPRGWEVRPQPVPIPALAQYRVQPFAIAAKVNPLRVNDRTHAPVALAFTQGYSRDRTETRMVVPLANAYRREGRLSIDGSLEDWSESEAIQSGPLVRMFDRASLQRHELRYADTSSSLYGGWSDETFYLAFRVTGVSRPNNAQVLAGRNYVAYQFRRAWGEDLAQIIVQPIYSDGSLGPLLHVVCKPGGNAWTERKLDPRKVVDAWQPFDSGIRYAGTLDGQDAWRGEVAIPWKAFGDPVKGRPVALRLNFSQHKPATGESASWAGPVDFGRDERLTGLIYLRELERPGMTSP